MAVRGPMRIQASAIAHSSASTRGGGWRLQGVAEEGATPPEATRRSRRKTPMRERAEAVGVSFEPTSQELRKIVAGPCASPGAVARYEICAHQKARLQRVSQGGKLLRQRKYYLELSK